jgi:hypothetical protein
MIFALISILTATAPAESIDLPKLNIEPVCRGIAKQARTPAEKGGPDLTFDDCLATEREIREQLVNKWSEFAPADKEHCVRETTMGGESSYTELITCLEMARDVRELYSSGRSERNH